MPVLRSPHDSAIARLAVPALGALAAEPLYLLVDTAIVGHLGTPELAALALAGSLLTLAVTLCNFLTYASTAQVARLNGVGREADAGSLAAQALWLALALGVTLALLAAALAPALVALMGGTGDVARLASPYLRVAAVGVPAALVALAGQGYLRGVGDLRTPLVIVVTAHAANVVLEVLFAFAVASAVLARVGAASLAAHLIAFQLFVFLALVLDAIAIAGQVIVGRALGAGDTGAARAAARRMLEWALAAGVLFAAVLLVLAGPLPHAFTGDPRVIERTSAVWPLFVLMQPAAALVFALDGILIGAGDTRYLKSSMLAAAAVFVAVSLVALAANWGIIGVWGGLIALMGVRLATLLARFHSERWAVPGVASAR